jgi:cytochrome c-type biogenesis protein CcmH
VTDKQLMRGTIAFSVVCALIAGIAVWLVHLQGEAGPSSGFANSDVSMQEIARASSALRSPATQSAQVSTEQGKQVASVPSLIGGLEKRLEANPDDPSGWALLAQSYAFTGQPDKAESAVQRAVGLGFDEAELRRRVDGAQRDPHVGIPGMQSASR